VLFSQWKVGRRGRVFKMFKLRTMKLGAEREDDLRQSTTPYDPRLLRIGKLMRRLNADEVPQFWNVLRGEMSLVGPRPERPSHSAVLQDRIPHYSDRCASKPGMTGWAQVNGFRGATSLQGRLRCDLFYLEHWSLLLDLKIMIRTLFLHDPAFRGDLQRNPPTFCDDESCLRLAEPALTS
jgi:lipopolysaccharide/colanic/teichoic acid biosynthesis glycosyltransferase